MLTEALFAVAKMWLSIDQGMDKENVVYIYIHTYIQGNITQPQKG